MKKSKRKRRNKKSMLPLIGGITLGVMVIMLLTALILNMAVESQPANKLFLSGTLPQPDLSGPYKGTWSNTSSWQGKEFDSQKNTGINIIDNSKKYPFETSNSKSLHSNQTVLKLNYNISDNPLWLRFIVDEISQTKPGNYQGKVYVQFLPGLAVAITYFELKK